MEHSQGKNFRYAFDPDNGAYAGIVRPEVKGDQRTFPPNCTPIPPPFKGVDFVPVWDFKRNVWETIHRGEALLSRDFKQFTRSELVSLANSIGKLEQKIDAIGSDLKRSIASTNEDLVNQLERTFVDVSHINREAVLTPVVRGYADVRNRLDLLISVIDSVHSILTQPKPHPWWKRLWITLISTFHKERP